MGTLVDVQTTRFGYLETAQIPEQGIFRFPRGIPGFEETTAFALIEDDRYCPLYWLQSLSDPAIGFVLVDPSLLVADYEVQLSDEDVALLEMGSDEQAQVLCLLAVPGGMAPITANLRAPVALSRGRQRGAQIILGDDRYALRHPVDAFQKPRQNGGHTPC